MHYFYSTTYYANPLIRDNQLVLGCAKSSTRTNFYLRNGNLAAWKDANREYCALLSCKRKIHRIFIYNRYYFYFARYRSARIGIEFWLRSIFPLDKTRVIYS